MSTRICKPQQCVHPHESKFWRKRHRAPATQRHQFNRRLVFVERGWCVGRFTTRPSEMILKDRLYHFTKGYRIRSAG